MAAHGQLAARYPWPFLFFFFFGRHLEHDTGHLGRSRPRRAIRFGAGCTPFFGPTQLCPRLARPYGTQHLSWISAPQWLSSRLNKVGVIRGKYFSVVPMNGPLYSRPLNCISMGFDRGYQELLKNSVVKEKLPRVNKLLECDLLFSITVSHKTILNPVISHLVRTHFSSVLSFLKVSPVTTERGDAIRNALCVAAKKKEKKKHLFSDERKPQRLRLELFQSGHLRPKNIKDLSTVQGQR